jgi:hypothetical protein
VVHTLFARPDGRVPEGSCQSAPPNALQRQEAQGAHRYVLVPDALILAFANDPLAVGVYAAIARLVVAAKDAVPLAARDLAAWMGSEREADRAAIMRRIASLGERGWLMITRTRASKHHLLPTWGRDRMGTVWPWRFDQPDSERPAHVRGRRVPLGLLDTYVGRLDPQSGQGPALVSRYFTRPLLDLTDIGVYVIGLRAEVAPTPRLRHLGLHAVAGVTAPADAQSLMELAAAGQLTTLVSDVVEAVHLSVQGQSRLGIASTIAVTPQIGQPGFQCGSLGGSRAGSAGRSHNGGGALTSIAQEDAQSSSTDLPRTLIAWDVGNDREQTNHDSSPDPMIQDGRAADVRRLSAVTLHAQRNCGSTDCDQHRCSEPRAECSPATLAASVVMGHSGLNPGRLLSAGEWHEVLALQETYGPEQLLIWQARASRVRSERLYGITPAYYHACAARAALDAYRPRRGAHAHNSRADPGITPSSVLDPACDALLLVMGVRERRKLGAVPYALIASWQDALAHPGMAAQFTSPIGFAVAQMERRNLPPSAAELDCWSERARRKNDRYESWRFVEPVAVSSDPPNDEQKLEARVRALAPPDAELEDLCALACALEAGASDSEALAQLPFKASVNVGGHEGEEQACARRYCG